MNVNYMPDNKRAALRLLEAGCPFMRPSDSDLYLRVYNTITGQGFVMNAVILRTGTLVALDPMLEVTVCPDAMVTRKQ